MQTEIIKLYKDNQMFSIKIYYENKNSFVTKNFNTIGKKINYDGLSFKDNSVYSILDFINEKIEIDGQKYILSNCLFKDFNGAKELELTMTVLTTKLTPNNELYIWSEEEQEWVVDLDKAKYVKREQLKKEREKLQNEPLIYDGDSYQVDFQKDLKNIRIIQLQLLNSSIKYLAEGLTPEEIQFKMNQELSKSFKWTLTDNTTRVLSVTDILDLFNKYVERYERVHYICNTILYQLLDQATTMEEIKRISFEEYL